MLSIDEYLESRPDAGDAPLTGNDPLSETELTDLASQFDGFADKIRDLVVGIAGTNNPEEFGLKTAREFRDSEDNVPSGGYYTIEWRVRMRYPTPKDNGCGCGCGCACGG